MAARRLILVMLVLLVLSSVAAALVPVEERRRDQSTNTTTSTSTSELPSGGLLSRSVDTAARRPTRIKAQAGDLLELVVTSPRPAQVAISDLDELEDTDPEFAARFNLYLLDTGRYPVEVIETDGGEGRRIASIEVE